MRKIKKIIVGNILLISSLLFIATSIYIIHYFIFGDIKQTISGLILSLAYVPIGMLYEILLLDKILEKKEELNSAQRMNLIKGSFYHEVGDELIKLISKGDIKLLTSKCNKNIFDGCSGMDFDSLVEVLEKYECEIDFDKIDLERVYNILERRDDFILNLITNSNIDKYKDFIDILMAVLHLRDELQLKVKGTITFNEGKDREHLTDDICDAYTGLIEGWIEYMKDLKEFYPTLFNEVLRSSVFNNPRK